MAWVQVQDSTSSPVWTLAVALGVTPVNRIQSPIRYGEAPAGTIPVNPPIPLTAGSYRVDVRRAAADSLPFVLRGGGTTTFVIAAASP